MKSLFGCLQPIPLSIVVCLYFFEHFTNKNESAMFNRIVAKVTALAVIDVKFVCMTAVGFNDLCEDDLDGLIVLRLNAFEPNL